MIVVGHMTHAYLVKLYALAAQAGISVVMVDEALAELDRHFNPPVIQLSDEAFKQLAATITNCQPAIDYDSLFDDRIVIPCPPKISAATDRTRPVLSWDRRFG